MSPLFCMLAEFLRLVLWRKVSAAYEAIDHAVYEEIARCRAGDRAYDGTILALLVEAVDDQGMGFTDEEVYDELVTLIFAGHETLTSTLCWALHHLATHPSAQERLFDELSEGLPSGIVEPELVRDMPYLTAVVNETLRLSPVAPAIPRRLQEPMTLAGYDLPAGAVIAPSPLMAHRDPEAWERPEQFEPDRFLVHRPSPFGFFPFGGGTRRCAGTVFARYEMAVVLAQLVLDFELSPRPGSRPKAFMHGPTVAPSPDISILLRVRELVRR